jgi:hypothetical protein
MRRNIARRALAADGGAGQIREMLADQIRPDEKRERAFHEAELQKADGSILTPSWRMSSLPVPKYAHFDI